MMAKSMEFWRGYFSGANSDIFDIIENAVVVASLDHPEAFRLKRERIAELLFTCQLKKSVGCEKVEISVLKDGKEGVTLLEGEKLISGDEVEAEEQEEQEEAEEEAEEAEEEEGEIRGKESEVDVCDDGHAMVVSYEEAEELNDELEKESQLMEEVLRIKKILDNREESETVLLDSLRRLQLMDISVEILKVTEIGKSVNGAKKHGSKKIKDLVKILIKGWVDMLDSYHVNATTAIKEDTPDSIKTSTVEDDGLPSPPLEEGAFVNHAMELSPEFFDGMDDDGNPVNNGDVKNSRGSGRKPPLKDGNVPKHKPQQLPKAVYPPPPENKVQQPMKEEAVLKKKAAAANPNKPSGDNTVPIKPRAEQKVIKKSQPERVERSLPKKPFAHQADVSPKYRQQSANGATRTQMLPPQKEKLRPSDESGMQVKIEAAKRKLQERYQEPETAKKQRINQITPLHDIRKQGASQNRITKPVHSNHNRHCAMDGIRLPTERHSTGY